MDHSRRTSSRSRMLVIAVLLAGAASFAAREPLAQSVEELQGNPTERLVTPRTLRPHGSARARASLARAASGPDSIWIGHSIQTRVDGSPNTYSWGPNHIGRGDNRPKPGGTAAENSGLWDWDHFVAGESDSLQGWWPMRRVYSITGGLTFSDDQRPWWAVDIGNQGNYVLNGSQARARGVLSYWHVDGGSSATQVTIPGTNPLPMTWAPLAGAGSAWCGLRAHGDITYMDPLTNNPYNAMVLELNGENGGGATSGVGTNKKLPGYPSQMDQLLYADVELTSSSATLNLSFLYQTAMSTGATSTAATRTGWFQYDPTVVGAVAVAGPNLGAPNYIGNSGLGQPADSFMVYIGVPVNISSTKLANNAPAAPVYDLKRRWLSEVIALDKPIKQVLHVAGNTNTSFSLVGESMAGFFSAQSGLNRYVRVVFRSKTNRGFDDLNASTSGQFWSGGKGAVMIDNVAIGGTGLAGGTLKTSTFDSPGDIDNSISTDDLVLNGNWRATGKPPGVFFHAHPLAGGGPSNYEPLVYQDICGPPGSPARFCNMAGVVISAGDHDNGEAAGGLVAGMPERERMDGILSPTVLLANDGIPGHYNDVGVDVDGADPLDDYYVWYDIYTGIFNLFFTGNFWNFAFQSYPGRQSDGVRCWGELRVPGTTIFNPGIQCFQDVEGAYQNALIRTVAANPESLRVYLGKVQECFRFNVTGSSCSSKGGAYFDNVSFLISDASWSGGAGSGVIAVDIWRWINDTFPTNDGTSLVPGVAVAPGSAGFDTAAAYIKSGLNIAQNPGTVSRFDIPGDSVIVVADVVESATGLGRVDMVFRIKPGVGNYHVIGDPNSGLRPVPTDPTNIVVAGDASFWGQYLKNPGAPNGPLSTDAGVGEMGNLLAQGRHGNPSVVGPGGGANWWNRNVWNSARMDTADVNIWPLPTSIAPGLFDVGANFYAQLEWMATYHESDPKYTILGITHNKCFLVVPFGPVNSTNIRCDGTLPPAYAAGTPTTTIEGTKIIPDGLLTPGAHVQYFFRAQDDGGHGPSGLARNDAAFAMSPETSFVSPQVTEGSTDGHRWQQFGVLPDRWKERNFGGMGMACMLYVDACDRRGDERIWVSVADSLGLTASGQRGAHNGWRASCNDCLTDASGNPIDVSGDPSIAVYTHGGQPGTAWDMYGVKAAEQLTSGSGQLGSRMGPQATGFATGKDSKQGPTAAMLRTYYPMLLIHTGDLNSGILGPFINRGQDDIALLQDYLSNPAPGSASTTHRALLIEGDGFVQSEYTTGITGGYPSHLALLRDYLGVTIKQDGAGHPQYSYQPWSGNYDPSFDLTLAPPLGSNTLNLVSSCIWGDDVLDPVVSGLNAQPSAYYENVGTNGPYVAGVFTPHQDGKFYESIVDGWDPRHLVGTGGSGSVGRLGYYFNVANVLKDAASCFTNLEPIVPLDVPGGGHPAWVDFVQLRNNPFLTGRAIVHLGLAHSDRVTARIFDVGGRLVRTLADRTFPAGEYDLAWDGTDDGGRRLERGVYFTQFAYAKSGFKGARKLILLR